MKKRILALLLVLVMSLMCSCSIFGGVSNEGSVSIVVENADGSYDVFEVDLVRVENKDEGVKGVLEYLSQEKNDKLYVEMVDGGYGAYVTAIGNITENPSDGAYVMVYTSVATDGYEGGPTVEYEGIVLAQSGVGISSMTVADGTVILFRIEAYEY